MVSLFRRYLIKTKKCFLFTASKKSSPEPLNVENEEQQVPVIPVYTSENKTPDTIKGAEEFNKTKDGIESLVSDMGGAVDVIRVSTQNDDHLEESADITSYSESKENSETAYNKNVLNISKFNSSSEDFAIVSNSSRVESNRSMSSSKVESEELSSSVVEPEYSKEQGDRPVSPAAGADDFLEYRADDSDRVYAVKNYAEGEYVNDVDRDPDKLHEGSSTQHNLSDNVEAADSEVTESEVPAQLEENTAEEVRVR
jgi:hypothetical protein